MTTKKLLTLSVCCLTLTVSAQNIRFKEEAINLCNQLTLDEKISLMMDNSPSIPRLGIPAFQWWSEALHGVARNGLATVFPQTIGMAASFDPVLLQQVYTAVSDEARAKAEQARRSGNVKRYQGLSFWTPNINIFRDPRWGRGQETYGEDPYLTSQMGLSVVRGLQGPDDVPYRKLLACAKHFAVHSGPESLRHQMNIEDLSPRDLWETYLPAFKALVEQGHVAEVMCAYQRFDGQPCCGSNRLLEQILRQEWHFPGLVVSDCGAISDFWEPGHHGVSPDAAHASAKAVLAGTDVECGRNYANLGEAVKSGLIKETDIDSSVVRLLTARFSLGDIDTTAQVAWRNIPTTVVDNAAHRELALRMARESIVLLQNKKNTLPLSPRMKILVVGDNATDSTMQWGNYNGFPSHTITILQGIEALDPNTEFISGCGLLHNEVFQSRMNEMTCSNGQRGMKATYWNNEDLDGDSVATQCFTEPIRQDNGGATVFAPGVNLTHFSARYEGTLHAQATEALLIRISGDDGIRLAVNGERVVSKWNNKGKTQTAEYTLHTEAGKDYAIEAEYKQREGSATFHFDIAKRLPLDMEAVLKKARQVDAIVYVGGLSPKLEGEEMKVDAPGFKGGDRTSIELPQAQREAIQTIASTGKPVIMINCSGSAVGLAPESKRCSAILQAWYPGEEGGRAVADVLFGKVCPSGKLPITFYYDDSQLPDFTNYSMQDRTYRYFKGKPLFAFGHGLSYTTFNVSKPIYRNHSISITVSNTGKRIGTETIQLYAKRLADTNGPIKRLKAFRRISLRPSEKKTVIFPLNDDVFTCWDASSNTMRPLYGPYEFFVGTSSDEGQTVRANVIR
jgi:beta-glucosidase